METEPSRIVASPTGTMERVLTEEGFDPDRVRPLQSCGLQVVLRHHRITLSALARLARWSES